MTQRQTDLAAVLQRVQRIVEGFGSEEEADHVYLRLAQGLLARGALSEDALSLPRFGDESAAKITAGVPPPSQLGQELASLAQIDLSLSIHLVRSGMPVIGPLLDLIRAPFHRLSLFYVQRLAERQAAYNRQVSRILLLLAERVERPPAEKRGAENGAAESRDG